MTLAARKLLASGLAGAVCVASPVALAETAPPKIPHAYTSARLAGISLHQLAQCLVRSYPTEIKGVFEPKGDASSREARLTTFMAPRMKEEGCLRARKMRFGWSIFRGTLAEKLLADSPGVSTDRVRPAAFATPGEYSWTARRMTDADFDRVEPIATCVVAANPLAARALLATKPVTGEERDALAALHGELGSCIGSDKPIALHPMNVRAAIAEALYLGSRQTVQEAKQ